MIIGVPKEIKDQEMRVGIVPSGVRMAVRAGHTVLIEQGAGMGSGIPDDVFRAEGANIRSRDEVWDEAELIVKVKEPQKEEWPFISPKKVLYTYFHFASSRPLTDAMIESGATCIAYETVTMPDRSHPLLTPMSEIAGRLSVQQGAKYLESPSGGRGTLMGGVPGVKPARVTVIGGGVVGWNAAKVAAGMGARVTILDINLERLRYIDDVAPRNISTLYCSEYNIHAQLSNADIVIGSVYVSGAKAPHLVTRDDLARLPKGAVLVDVAIDQGGCFETSRPTSHSNPIYIDESIIHYCVTNMPGAVARTSTYALTNATTSYLGKITSGGWKALAARDAAFALGVNITGGKVTHPGVAQAHGLDYTDLQSLL